MRIALFDSGYGGLTVLSHARRVLPSEEFIFYADRDHVPYGTKSVPVVRGFVRTAFRFLIEQQRADAVVVACNTATSVAVNEMRRLYDVPIIGMEPAVKKALTHDAEHRVLVTATRSERIGGSLGPAATGGVRGAAGVRLLGGGDVPAGCVCTVSFCGLFCDRARLYAFQLFQGYDAAAFAAECAPRGWE